MGERAPALRAAADKVRAAQAQVASAAKTGDQNATAAAMAQVQAATGQVEALLKDMNPAQASQVKKALGLM